MTPRRTLLWMILFAALTAGAVIVARRPHRPAGPLEISLWYWHQPFRISTTEAQQLSEMGIKRLFVRAGTFTNQDHPSLVLNQEWHKTPAPIDVVLVFNADKTVLTTFGKTTNAVLASCMSTAIEAQRAAAVKSGVRVTG